MQKILLIGELEEIIRSVNECLENDFQVRISKTNDPEYGQGNGKDCKTRYDYCLSDRD